MAPSTHKTKIFSVVVSALICLNCAVVDAAQTENKTEEDALKLVRKARALADFDYNRNYWITADEYDRAIELLQKAIELEPDNSTAHLALGNVYRGKAMLEPAGSPQHNRIIDKALVHYRKAAKLEPDSPQVLRKLVNHLLIVYGRDSKYSSEEKEEILKTYQTVFNLDPNQWRERYNYGLLLIRFGDTESGIKQMKVAIEHMPWRLTIEMKGDLADVLESLERYEEALEVLKIGGTSPWEERIERLKKRIKRGT